MPKPIPGSLIVTDFSRGWDPTHPDEQLVGANLSQSQQLGASVGAPFESPDVHDVDFWRGFLEKRNGKSKLGPVVTASSILSIFTYLYTNITGSITRTLMAFAGVWPYFYNGSIWTQLLNVAGISFFGATDAFFATLKNLLFITNSNTRLFLPSWWDGSSSYMGLHGMRMSFPYMTYFGTSGNCSQAAIASLAGNTFTMSANQPASGLFRGKAVTIFITSPLISEPAIVSSFTTTGTPGTANYYVTSITMVSAPRYSGTYNYNVVAWNGGTTTASNAGGSITTTGTVTCIRLMAVTDLKSGGQRASEFSVDVPTGGSSSITLANLQMNYGDGQLFGTDIPSNATTWYMTVPFDPQLVSTDPASGPSQLFYLIPDNKGVATATDTGFNPMPNSTTTFTIKTGRNASTDTTLIANTAVDAQGYFTGQVDAPYYKFMLAWQDFLVLLGDVWNPSSIWITAFGAPQVIGTQGGLDGAFIQVPNGNDGQVIVAAYVWRGDLYVFKTNSVYLVSFNGNTSLTPFNVTKLQGNFGAVSPKCIAETDNYVVFLSPSGVCAITGLTVSLLPENEQIRAKFLGPNSWNISQLSTSQAMAFPAKKQVWFQVSTATAGDTVLVYDWSRRNFLYDTGSVAETALFQDLGSSPPVSYGGDSNGQVWTLDVPGTDEVIPVDMRYESPWLSLGDPTSFKQLKWIWLAGEQQQAGTMHMQVYFDYNLKQAVVLDFDMTDPQFQVGLYKPINNRNKYMKIVLTNNDSGIPVAIRYMRIDFVNQGPGI